MAAAIRLDRVRAHVVSSARRISRTVPGIRGNVRLSIFWTTATARRMVATDWGLPSNRRLWTAKGSQLVLLAVTAQPRGSDTAVAFLPRQRPGGRSKFGHKPQIVDNDDGIVLDHTVEHGKSA